MMQPTVRLGEHGGTYEVRATDLPCTVCNKEIQPGQLYIRTVCNKEIQPGQLYIPGDLGPRHLGCGA